ncbi:MULTISPECIES: NADPH-dependent F420 reductase [Burkholderiaceae]|uniref:Polyketide synthase n=1 Tax=Caballeronia sordidicola TaxID=196367 RepID=A0A242MCL8_CABSO|nr:MULTISPECIES: NADPH-dependent F420 reductase [Burkholderiaceae]AMH43092.1 NADP oxidoreductase coenzyme [Burkholderia sp. PAMC 26561]OTP68483.1 Polyketide synthase [Caballeronia sordidicola]
MNYAIIGLGKIGTAIAQAFARQGIEVAVAGRRPLDVLAAKIGPSLVAQRIEDAVKADVVILAVPFGTHQDIGRTAGSWEGKIVIDATNAYDVPPEELGGLPSTAAVAKAFPGAKLVKAFNHLPAGVLAQGPTPLQGGRRVVFVAGDDDAASASVAKLVDRLGFAPIELGKIGEGGLLIQARGRTWAHLIFQDLVKFE